MSVVAVDIGGANLKASDGQVSLSASFPLWKCPDQLSQELQKHLSHFHPYGPIAVTMTGELADCYATRAEGVSRIIRSVCDAFPRRQIAVWQTGGEFVSAEESVELPELVAAANWHALATWAGRACPDHTALLLDIGSTTTDIIPLKDGLPASTATTDLGRLLSGELVYTGVRRTPLCAVASSVRIEAGVIPLAAELFATTYDVALLLEEIEEQPDCLETANGRPATRAEALHRVARSVCSDPEQLAEAVLIDIATQCRKHQLETLVNALRRVLGVLTEVPRTVLVAGEGEYLAEQLITASELRAETVQRLSMNQMLGPQHSQAACAFALARLASERL